MNTLEITKQQKIASLDSFTRAYLVAALWITTGDDGEPLDRNYSVRDLSLEALDRAIEDCRKFLDSDLTVSDRITNDCLYTSCPSIEYAGHDFWLTRNGHGCGFWDGDWTEETGEFLTKIAQSFGATDLYVGDDGELYFSR